MALLTHGGGQRDLPDAAKSPLAKPLSRSWIWPAGVLHEGGDLKKKQCPECEEYFVTTRPLQKVCSVTCSITRSRAQRIEAQKRRKARELRDKKQAIKTKGQHTKEAQAAFNAWVRERDYDEPCISCQRHHKGQWHAGHFKTVGAHPELRFDSYNVHKQCSACNNYKGGNLIEYRINLCKKIGEEKVLWLEGPHEPKKHNIEQIIEIKRLYRELTRKLKKQREGK
jgi:hypothetical protein